MLTLLDHVFHREFIAECSRLLLLSAAAAYVSANVRLLAARHGWDNHLLGLLRALSAARRWLRRHGWRWLMFGAAGGGVIALVLVVLL